jgi:hypothetical protein
MKINTDCLCIPTIVIGLYSLYKLNNKIKTIEKDIDIILRTHNRYMEVQELQCKSINDLYCKFRNNNKIEPSIFYDDEPEEEYIAGV